MAGDGVRPAPKSDKPGERRKPSSGGPTRREDVAKEDFRIMREYRLTYAELNALTFAQIANLVSAGNPPRPGARRFKSTAEARAWREAQEADGEQ